MGAPPAIKRPARIACRSMQAYYWVMRRQYLPVLLALLGVLAYGTATAGEPSLTRTLTAREMLDRIDDLFRGATSHGVMTMKVKTAHWSRELKLEEWSEGKAKSMIRILSPQKERGTATLKVGNDIWNYLPKVKRVIKLPSSMMGDSWMGSHFTNDDLVKDSRMADDYDYTISFSGTRDGETVTEITCRPRPNAAVVWGKIIMRVRDMDGMPLAGEYYDEDMKLARTMSFSEFRAMGGRVVPARMTIRPADKPQESTSVVYQTMEFDAPLDRDTFSLRSLQR